jgi:hypothetical protein
MKRRGFMNRKGEVTVSTMIFIVLGLAVLVFLIIGLTQGFDIFFGTVGKVDPGDLQILAKACAGYANANLDISFCKFEKIDAGSNDEYINCFDERLKLSIENELNVDFPKESSCGVDYYKKFCEGSSISAGKWKDIDVNGKPCSDKARANRAGKIGGTCGLKVESDKLKCNHLGGNEVACGKFVADCKFENNVCVKAGTDDKDLDCSKLNDEPICVNKCKWTSA